MKCEESLSLISPYLDRELDPLRSREVEKHLHDCDGCAAVSKELQNLRAAVSGAPVSVAPPTDLERRLREALHREAGPLIAALRSSNWPRLTTPMGLALALAALLLLLTVINGGRADHAARPDALLA